MSVDKRVPGRSNEEIRRIADRTKSDYGTSRRRPVNISYHIQSGSVLTLFGRKKLDFVLVDDDELGDVDAKTESFGGVITITCKRGVHDRAEMGVGRDRMTEAHELGHAAMHFGAQFLREVGAAGIADNTIPPYISAEHQAKVFASAFLIHEDDAIKMVASALKVYGKEGPAKEHAAQEISVEFGVSLEAAEVCFDQLVQKIKHQETAERIRTSADEAIAIMRGETKSIEPNYLDHPCPSCHLKKLLPIGNKVMCNNPDCGYVGDTFQDGDSLT